MNPNTENVPASVLQRLRNRAKVEGRSFDELLHQYANERFLFRLSVSQYKRRLILKGGCLLLYWIGTTPRPTKDCDFLGLFSNNPEETANVLRGICNQPVDDDDGISFDAASLRTFTIDDDSEYAGIRLTFAGYLGRTRISMQVDIGFGDEQPSGTISVDFPTLLGHPAPNVFIYSREAMIAEKFEAMVRLGTINSRMKDFFDAWFLSQSFDFDGVELAGSIKTTFTRRGTSIEATPICFTDTFFNDPRKAQQWRAFLRTGKLKNAPPALPDAMAEVIRFLQPVSEALASGAEFEGHWPQKGPWNIASASFV
jgi:hypothetical protein